MLDIIALRVPGIIQEGDMESVVLDCDYTLKQSDGFVLKWYFTAENSKSPKLIYQWIPEKDGPQAIGPFRSKYYFFKFYLITYYYFLMY